MDHLELTSISQELHLLSIRLTNIVSSNQNQISETSSVSSDHASYESSTRYMSQDSDTPKPFVYFDLPSSSSNKKVLTLCKNHRLFGNKTINCKGNCSFNKQ